LRRSALPRSATPRTDRPTFGPKVSAVARQLGYRLLSWQRLVADGSLEHDGDGNLVYRDVNVTTPRQQGKSLLVLALVTHRLLSSPGQIVVYAAQSRNEARKRLLDSWWPRIRRSSLRSAFDRPTRQMGGESLRAANGSILYLASSEESSGHGDTTDLVVLDEAWSLDAATEQGMRPGLLTRPNGMLVVCSTAGTVRSAWWRERVDKGRQAVEDGVTAGFAHYEWSAPLEAEVSDPATWYAAMPALGITIDEATVAADFTAMAEPEFRRAALNQWVDDLGIGGWNVFSADDWARAVGEVAS
jgi:phage terminase large subunit-like protein